MKTRRIKIISIGGGNTNNDDHNVINVSSKHLPGIRKGIIPAMFRVADPKELRRPQQAVYPEIKRKIRDAARTY